MNPVISERPDQFVPAEDKGQLSKRPRTKPPNDHGAASLNNNMVLDLLDELIHDGVLFPLFAGLVNLGSPFQSGPRQTEVKPPSFSFLAVPLRQLDPYRLLMMTGGDCFHQNLTQEGFNDRPHVQSADQDSRTPV
ncbi:Hypothetical predicted protein [Xyrichtys novacula]|uniref:Uncharacterized protein n=1 Tax=Xyrichtys novacula TaxID=13765 RepID=A0AAV1EN64_XYRNO|nr:Hypothetical predicted protein [Xyrichtys novacula]